MDWIKLRSHMQPPPGMTGRGRRLWELQQVFSGRMYDCLEFDFGQENNGAGEYIPIDQRRPNVQTNLCRSVVDDTVSLLFSDTHWPTLQGVDTKASAFLTAFMRVACVPLIMQMAAGRGSVGSSAILFETFKGVPKLSVLDTAFLTPIWSDGDGELVQVEENIVHTGKQLLESGELVVLPEGTADTTLFMCTRRWTRDETLVYPPYEWNEGGRDIKVSTPAKVRHNLKFVPIVWMKNIDTHDGSPDGDCSFERAISTVIAGDYTMSQNGRALRYSSDPIIVFTQQPDASSGDPEGEGDLPPTPRTSSRAIMAGSYNAKMLEITGDASAAALSFYRELRAMVLEQLHGNKTHPDKLAASQSGRAMEMMAQSLVWQADRLRSSYGDGGLVPLLSMAAAFTRANIMKTTDTGRKGQKNGLLLDGTYYTGIDVPTLSLHWPAWYPLTSPELLQLSQALSTSVDSGICSRETATRIFASANGAEPHAEWQLVKNWVAPVPAGQGSEGTTEDPKQTRKTSRSGPSKTRAATA